MLRVLMLVAGLGMVAAVKFPSFITRCARSDPEFSKCALASARAAKDDLIRGDRAFRLQPMDPMQIPQLRVEQAGSVGLNVTMRDIVITGLSGLTFTDNFSLDVDKKVLAYEVFLPRLQLICEYEMQGRILILPITGKGPSNVTLVETSMRVRSPYKLVTHSNGKKYLFFERSDVTATPKRAYTYFGNLFNGDPLLGPQTNLFLNENWKEIFEDVGPSVSEGIGAAIQQNIQALMDKVPFDELIPETLSA